MTDQISTKYVVKIQEDPLYTKKFTGISLQGGEIKDKFLVYIKNINVWIETFIFIISVLGAMCMAMNIMKGWLFWLVSNTISIFYFYKQNQYPLAIQQFVFLIVTCIGIYQSWEYIIMF